MKAGAKGEETNKTEPTMKAGAKGKGLAGGLLPSNTHGRNDAH